MEDASSECEGQFLFLSRDELFNAFEDFKKDTCTGWRCVFKDSKFEMDVKKLIEEAKNASRIKWSVSAMNDGICSKFDGIPILSAGTMQFHCHQGVDIDLPQKNKRKQIKDDK
ncbi:Hypothetical predicted protein, partial [Paramuricea clavata]